MILRSACEACGTSVRRFQVVDDGTEGRDVAQFLVLEKLQQTHLGRVGISDALAAGGFAHLAQKEIDGAARAQGTASSSFTTAILMVADAEMALVQSLTLFRLPDLLGIFITRDLTISIKRRCGKVLSFQRSLCRHPV